jgi:hypothetical protein
MTGSLEVEAAIEKKTPQSVMAEIQDFEHISQIVLRSATISIKEPSSSPVGRDNSLGMYRHDNNTSPYSCVSGSMVRFLVFPELVAILSWHS